MHVVNALPAHQRAACASTRSPIAGKFGTDQQMMYTAVLDAVTAVEQAMRPGVSWPDMHRLASRVLLAALVKVCGNTASSVSGNPMAGCEPLVAQHSASGG